jgi:hypothetical protein
MQLTAHAAVRPQRAPGGQYPDFRKTVQSVHYGKADSLETGDFWQRPPKFDSP